MNNFINYNGRIFNENEPVLLASDRSYRYGEGLFETMKVADRKINMADLHFERLMVSLQILNINLPEFVTVDRLKNEVLELCTKNDCSNLARVRLSVSRGNNGLNDSDNDFQYLIECWPLEDTFNELNENGLVIDVFSDARKSMDKFSNLKSANHLPYVMAAKWAKENKLNEALVLNAAERICDAAIANIFWIKEGIIFTPSLSEGCIAGVMRRYLLGNLGSAGFSIKEQILEINDLETADEVFLTNAVRGIRWVKQFRNKEFSRIIITVIYKKLLKDKLA